MEKIEKLDALVKAASPSTLGVSVGRWSDKASWSLTLSGNETPEEIAAAQGVMSSFDADAYQPFPDEISDRQFYQGLAIAGLITQVEALAAVKTGAIPAAIQAFVGQIPDANDKFNAEMLLSGAVTFKRSHPLVDQIGAAQGMSSDQIDDFWRSCAALG